MRFALFTVILASIGSQHISVSADLKGCLSPPCLYWSNLTHILKQDPTKAILNKLVVIGPEPRIISVDLDVDNNMIYYSDIRDYTIKRVQLNDTSQKQTIIKLWEEPHIPCIAVEWRSGLIYWSNYKHDLIEVAKLNGSYRRVLHHKNINVPRGIAVSPDTGYLFWVDQGPPSRIERSYLNGQNRSVLRTLTSSYRPEGMLIDHDKKTIFWADQANYALMRMDFDGGNFATVFRLAGVLRPFDVAMFKDHLVWGDWARDALIMCNSSLTNQIQPIRMYRYAAAQPMGLVIFDPSRQTLIDKEPCSENNGGCSHLCLPKPGKQFDQQHSCACPLGIALESDNKTCKAGLSKFILVADRTRPTLYRISLDTTEFIREPLPIPIKNMSLPLAVHYDPVEQFIYWGDHGKDAIYRVKQDGSEFQMITDASVPMLTGLSVDYVGRKLFWSEGVYDVIEGSNLDGTMRIVLVQDGLDTPWSLELHHKHKLIFWSEVGNVIRISRAGMDGKNRKQIVLFSNSLSRPQALTIDYMNDRLFWIDHRLNVIESSELDGTDRKLLKSFTQSFASYGIAINNNMLYWSEMYAETVTRMDLATNQTFILTSGLYYPMELCLYDQDEVIRINATDNCQPNNGGCSYVCLSGINGTSSCFCPDGQTLQDDKKTCPDTTPPTITCPDNITVGNNKGTNTAAVNWSLPRASDNSGLQPTVTIHQPPTLTSPAQFLIGVHTLVYMATDTAGNNATCQFTITVKDTTPPTITCPDNITVDNNKGTNTAAVSWSLPQASDNSGLQPEVTIHQPPTLTSPARFLIGVHTLVYMATDTAGNNATCQFTITVKDTTPPTITCPDNITVGNNKGTNTAAVNWSLPQASDNSGEQPTVTIHQPPTLTSPAQFLIGVHTLVYMATDTAGNNATCQFTITVKDTTPPTITCPDNIIVDNNKGTNTAAVNWSLPQASDNSGEQPTVTIHQPPSLTSPAQFLIGVHTLVYMATDTAGNNATCQFTITVKDIEAPYAQQCRSPRTTNILSETHHTNFPMTKVLFTDNDRITQTTLVINNMVQPNQDITSVSLPWGENVIEYRAYDRSGLYGNCTHYVMVASTTCSTIQNVFSVTNLLNGDLKCEPWITGHKCRLQCKDGFDYSVKEERYKYCVDKDYDNIEQNEKKMEQNARFAGCTKTTNASMLVLKGTVTYTIHDCLTRTQQAIKEKFKNLLETNIIDTIRHCKASKEICTVKNIAIEGCSSNGTKPSPDKKNQRTLNIKYQVYIQDTSSATSEKIVEEMRKAINEAQLDIVIDNIPKAVLEKATVQSLGIVGCEEGAVATSTGFCAACPLGYMHNIDLNKCKPCPADEYQDTTGRTSCKFCPDGKSTGLVDGAADVLSCNIKSVISGQRGNKKGTTNYGLIIGSVLAGIIVICLVVTGIFFYRRRTTGINALKDKPEEPVLCMNAVYEEEGSLDPPISFTNPYSKTQTHVPL